MDDVLSMSRVFGRIFSEGSRSAHFAHRWPKRVASQASFPRRSLAGNLRWLCVLCVLCPLWWYTFRIRSRNIHRFVEAASHNYSPQWMLPRTGFDPWVLCAATDASVLTPTEIVTLPPRPRRIEADRSNGELDRTPRVTSSWWFCIVRRNVGEMPVRRRASALRDVGRTPMEWKP